MQYRESVILLYTGVVVCNSHLKTGCKRIKVHVYAQETDTQRREVAHLCNTAYICGLVWVTWLSCEERIHVNPE